MNNSCSDLRSLLKTELTRTKTERPITVLNYKLVVIAIKYDEGRKQSVTGMPEVADSRKICVLNSAESAPTWSPSNSPFTLLVPHQKHFYLLWPKHSVRHTASLDFIPPA